MEDVTRLDIQRDGLDRPQGGIGGRSAAAQRHKEYLAHLERMKWDDDYRYDWEENERTYLLSQQKHNI